jgi:hypothetical protein
LREPGDRDPAALQLGLVGDGPDPEVGQDRVLVLNHA